MKRPVLVIGYGNTLRSDDGVGPAAAAALSCDTRAFGLTVLRRHQLTPELAADVATAGRLILIDAEVPDADWSAADDGGGHGEAARITVRAIEPAARDGAASSHHLDPQTLLGLAAELYGSTPRTYLLSVRGTTFEAGEELTDSVRAAVPLVVEAALELAGSITGA